MEQKGRKSKYEEYILPYIEKIPEWCGHMTEKQIAQSLGVGYSTFSSYKKDDPELTEALKKGKRVLVFDLRSSLIKRAKGYKYTEKKTITEHVKWPEEIYEKLLDAGLSDSEIAESRLVKTEVSEKQMPPDVAALNLALKNYDPDNWANDPQMLKIREKELKLREKQVENNTW